MGYTDEQKRILFPSDFNEIRFKENIDVPFHIVDKVQVLLFCCNVSFENKILIFFVWFQNVSSKFDHK